MFIILQFMYECANTHTHFVACVARTSRIYRTHHTDNYGAADRPTAAEHENPISINQNRDSTLMKFFHTKLIHKLNQVAGRPTQQDTPQQQQCISSQHTLKQWQRAQATQQLKRRQFINPYFRTRTFGFPRAGQGDAARSYGIIFVCSDAHACVNR